MRAAKVRKTVRRYSAKKADHRHGRLLRTRRNWPCSRTPDQHDELSPLHSITSSAATSKPAAP